MDFIKKLGLSLSNPGSSADGHWLTNKTSKNEIISLNPSTAEEMGRVTGCSIENSEL